MEVKIWNEFTSARTRSTASASFLPTANPFSPKHKGLAVGVAIGGAWKTARHFIHIFPSYPFFKTFNLINYLYYINKREFQSLIGRLVT